MRRLISRKFFALLLLVLLSPFAKAQDQSFTIPLKLNNFKEFTLYEDDHGYTMFVHAFPPNRYFHLLKDGQIVASHKVATNKVVSYAADERSFIVYFLTVGRTLTALTFDKSSGKVGEEKVKEPELKSKDKEYYSFTHQHKYHSIYMNEKLNTLSLYVYEGVSPKHVVTIPAAPGIIKYRDYEIRYIPYQKKIDIKDLGFDRHLYWQGDSLTFSMLVGDKLFVRHATRYVKAPNYGDDSLIVRVFDTKNNFKHIKTLSGNSETGFEWKTEPYLSALGDTVENDWKPKKKHSLLVDQLKLGFIHARSAGNGHYTMTLAWETSSTTGTVAAPGSSGMGGGATGVSITHYGPLHSFHTCLSENFEPVRCEQSMFAYQRAAQRSYLLDPDMGKKWKSDEQLDSRFKEFALTAFHDHVYLTYLDKKKNLFIIERFDEK